MYGTGPGTAQRPLRCTGRPGATAAGLLPAGGQGRPVRGRVGGRAGGAAAQRQPPTYPDEVRQAGGRAPRRPLGLSPAEGRRPSVLRQPALLPGGGLLLLRYPGRYEAPAGAAEAAPRRQVRGGDAEEVIGALR